MTATHDLQVSRDGRDRPAISHDTVRDLRNEVSDLLAARLAVRPVNDPASRRELARSLLSEVLAQRAVRRVHEGVEPWSVDEEFALADAVINALFGLGRLQPLVDDPRVENIEVNGHDQVWISYADGRAVKGEPVADSDEELVELIQSMVTRTGNAERTFTTANPAVHVRLEDGSRLAAMAWTTPRPQLVIRRHRVRDIDLDDLVGLGTVDPVLAQFLRAALLAGKNIVVTGLQNAGKTTLIRALANEFGPMERFATIEREYELFLHEMPDRHPRVVAMEAREGNSERDTRGRGVGEVGLSELVTHALRMNLRRIIVGEVRGSEVIPDAPGHGHRRRLVVHGPLPIGQQGLRPHRDAVPVRRRRDDRRVRLPPGGRFDRPHRPHHAAGRDVHRRSPPPVRLRRPRGRRDRRGRPSGDHARVLAGTGRPRRADAQPSMPPRARTSGLRRRPAADA